MAKLQDKSIPPDLTLRRIRDQVAMEINRLMEENKGKFTQEELVAYLVENGCTAQNGNYIDASHLSRRKKLTSDIKAEDVVSIWEVYEEQFTVVEIALIRQFFREKTGEISGQLMENPITDAIVPADQCFPVPLRSPQDVLDLDIRGEQRFIREMCHPFFKGYAGVYHCYFHSSVTHENQIIAGTLRFSENEQDGTCDAELVLDIPTGKKPYLGKLVISDKLRVCYCLLHGKSTGELCLMIFEYFGINQMASRLKYRVAEVVTVSAGGGNRPTAHRMLISYKQLTKQQQRLIGSQLRMNKRSVCIKASELDRFAKDYPQFQWAYEKILRVAEKDEYYRFSESEITAQKDFMFDGHYVHAEDTALCMCLLREAASAPKNNKVGKSVDDIVRTVLDGRASLQHAKRRRMPIRQKKGKEKPKEKPQAE